MPPELRRSIPTKPTVRCANLLILLHSSLCKCPERTQANTTSQSDAVRLMCDGLSYS